MLRGMRSAAGRIESLTPWVASDHFEELGRPQRFLHGGFGLLTVGNLAKPKFWALRLAKRLGGIRIPVTFAGDGAGSLVECWAARAGDGTVGMLVWNVTLDHARAMGDPRLHRSVTLRVTGLRGSEYRLTRWRVDAQHHDVTAAWQKLGGGDWPDEDQWRELAAADHLTPVEDPRPFTAHHGAVEVAFELAMPAISYVELAPYDHGG
jgi:xylan 1,4-beta-xylosidase